MEVNMFVSGFSRLREFGAMGVGDLVDSAELDHSVALTTRELELNYQQVRRLKFVNPKDKIKPSCIDCGKKIAQKRIEYYEKTYSTDHFRAVPLRCASCESKREF